METGHSYFLCNLHFNATVQPSGEIRYEIEVLHDVYMLELFIWCEHKEFMYHLHAVGVHGPCRVQTLTIFGAMIFKGLKQWFSQMWNASTNDSPVNIGERCQKLQSPLDAVRMDSP